MELSLFDYHLPEKCIAQTPLEPRDSSRLMALDRRSGAVQHLIFRDIGQLLRPGDVLVLNNTRVIPARLHATKQDSGGKAEILLLRKASPSEWRALVGGRGLVTGKRLTLDALPIEAEVVAEYEESERLLRFSQPIDELLHELGEMPLPPYIHTRLEDAERYQTVYSQQEGSAAAPTAGLHFTPDLLIALRDSGVKLATCTLHIGLDTFQPVRVDDITKHRVHQEWASLNEANARIINDAKLAGGRIIAVGTTSARTLETAGILSEGGDPAHPEISPNACPWRPVTAFERETSLFIYPGYRWRVLDGLITNFHLPKSTLLMMISALAGRENVLNAYEIAKQEGYRFFSFGDAMFIT